MALNFPDSPILGDIYTDNTSGFSYEWDGVVWKSYTPSATNNIKILDDISGSFNGSTQTFSLTSNAIAITPANAQQLRIVLGGVVKSPGTDYTISGSNITFTTPPTGGLSFSGVSLGPAVPINTVNDGSITPQKLSAGGPTWNSGGGFNVTGITTLNNKVKVGVGTTALIVEGDARITGILTIGTSSITLNGVNNTINVGTGVTITSSGIRAGVVSATTFVGDGSGLTGVGAGLPQVLTFSPLDEATNVSVGTNITLTFNQGVVKGAGNITLRNGSGIGTVIQTIGISSTSVSISGAQVTIDPPSILPISTSIYVGVDTGAFTNVNGQQYVGLSTYNFTTSDDQVSSYSPVNGGTNVTYESSIVLTFPFDPVRGTGTVELRSGSVGGTLIQSFDATTSNRISVSGNQWILDPTSPLPAGESIFVIIPNTAIDNYQGLNIGGSTKTYSFTVRSITNVSFSPAVSSTNVGIHTNIILTFDNTPVRGTGTIRLRRDEASGPIVESFDAASSNRISVSGNQWILDPTSPFGGSSLIYLVMPSTAINSFEGLTIGGGTISYGFTTQPVSLFGFGINNNGQLGQSNTTQYSSPIQIPGTTWNTISGNNIHSLATKSDGTLWVWGFNGSGQLGQNNRTQYSSPIQIPGTTWNTISGNDHSLATKTDGTLWVWGYNFYGQLGQNNRTQYSSPVQIPGTTWNTISGGDYHLLATKTDGTLWVWGYNVYGQLGQNNRTYYSSPVQIPGTTWNTISGNNLHSLATKTDGTLWAWGFNLYGNLGQNNRTYYSSPVQIPGTQWSSISAGNDNSLATKTDNTLWAWGYNGFGQLGQNNRTYYSSPVQIPGTSWSFISAGNDHSLATKTDNTLWVWGYNGFAQLGQNNRTYYSSPIQIPGTTWNTISGGSNHTLATRG